MSNEIRPDTRNLDRRNPADSLLDNPAPKTAADSAARPDRADDLYDDTLPRPLPSSPGQHPHPVIDSVAPSRQTDFPMPINLPLDHTDLRTGESNHPIGTALGAAIGAAIGAAAGAAIGAGAGPLLAAIGAACGAIVAAFAGAIGGRRLSESVMPSTDDHYWSRHYARRPYVKPGTPYNLYKPAYAFGVKMRKEYCEHNWSSVESQIQTAWQQTPEAAQLPWPHAAPAIRDAWDKLSPCDPDL